MSPTPTELKTALGFLRQSHLAIMAVASLFFNTGNSEAAARLRAIDDRISEEIAFVDRQLGAANARARS